MSCVAITAAVLVITRTETLHGGAHGRVVVGSGSRSYSRSTVMASASARKSHKETQRSVSLPAILPGGVRCQESDLPGRHVVRKRGESRPSQTVFICLPASLLFLAGFPTVPAAEGSGNGPPVLNNTSDPTSGEASYIGSAACRACHSDIGEIARVHGHSQALKRIGGAAPDYPAEADGVRVPEPPDERTSNDVSYVIGGYTHGALFVDSDGYFLTEGVAGSNTH